MAPNFHDFHLSRISCFRFSSPSMIDCGTNEQTVVQFEIVVKQSSRRLQNEFSREVVSCSSVRDALKFKWIMVIDQIANHRYEL